MLRNVVKFTVNTAVEIGTGTIGGALTRKVLEITPGGKVVKACVTATGLVATLLATRAMEQGFNKYVDEIADEMNAFQKAFKN